MTRRGVGMMCSMTLLLLLAAFPALAFWLPDGNAVCAAGGNQGNPVIVSDGAGGTIIAWRDWRDADNYDIYAQRLNAAGTPQWAADGVVICSAEREQYLPVIASDGLGGAVIAWPDFRDGLHWTMYAQRVDASGGVMWEPNGKQIAPSHFGLHQAYPEIIAIDGYKTIIVFRIEYYPDYYGIVAQCLDQWSNWMWGASGTRVCPEVYILTAIDVIPASSMSGGGVFVAWQDRRYGTFDIFANRVYSDGGMWSSVGVTVCAVGNQQTSPRLAPDGYGGMVVAWQDSRSGTIDIFAQDFYGSGNQRWPTNGIAVCQTPGDQSVPVVAASGPSNVIVAWQDDRSGTGNDIYAQQVSFAGAMQWGANGIAVCAQAANQTAPQIVADGSGGAVIGWMDDRAGAYDAAFVQRVDAAGANQWAANGLAVSAAAVDQTAPALLPDGAGGVSVAWADFVNGVDWDLHAQYIDGAGRQGYLPAKLLSVLDVPEDQGGWVRLTIGKSALDGDGEDHQIVMYNVWQQIEVQARLGKPTAPATVADPALVAAAGLLRDAGWPIREQDGRYLVTTDDPSKSGSLPPGSWELIGSFAACQMDQYIYRASTLADAVGTEIPYAVYTVTAHTTSPSVWYASDPASGYSVDNLPPEIPGGFAGRAHYRPGGLELSWAQSTENDFAYYTVHRGMDEGFVPSSENLILAGDVLEFFDAEWWPESGYFYKVAATDIHENLSGYALLQPAEVTGVEPPDAGILQLRLYPNLPNPFNPSTTIRYDIPRTGLVTLAVYDAVGRLVRVLVAEEQTAGSHTARWDGDSGGGRPVASGVYVCRLESGLLRESKRMTLVR